MASTRYVAVRMTQRKAFGLATLSIGCTNDKDKYVLSVADFTVTRGLHEVVQPHVSRGAFNPEERPSAPAGIDAFVKAAHVQADVVGGVGGVPWIPQWKAAAKAFRALNKLYPEIWHFHRVLAKWEDLWAYFMLEMDFMAKVF